MLGILSLYCYRLPNAAVLRAFHDGVCTSVRLFHLKLTISCLALECWPSLCCFLLVTLQCKMLYCCMDFFFFLYFQHCGFQDHVFNMSLIFVHFVSSYSEICTALSTIFTLSFKFYCCKNRAIKNSKSFYNCIGISQ